MNMPIFVMMCGISGVGKTDLTQMFSGTVVQESDTAHDQMVSLLQASKNVIYDAQNLTKAERTNTLKLLRKSVNFGDAICVYVQNNVLPKHKELDAKNKYTPIKALLQDSMGRIQVPDYDEGWSRIITTMAKANNE